MRHTKRTNSRSRRRKTQKTRRNKQQKGGATKHYLISAHGSSEGIRDMTPKTPVLYETHGYDILLYTYVTNFGDELSDLCGAKLQTYLTHTRDDPNTKPKCLKIIPHMNSAILNVKLYVESSANQTFIPGILDVSTVGDPKEVERFTTAKQSWYSNYRLSNAIETIRSHAETTYGKGHNIKIHVLSCM